jgi:preprotein translocase subunit SecF
MLNIIGHRKIFLSISAVMVIAAVAVIILFGFRLGIDFRGGTLWNFRVDVAPEHP